MMLFNVILLKKCSKIVISLTRKIVSEYDLYCVEWDVKPYYTIPSRIELYLQLPSANQ